MDISETYLTLGVATFKVGIPIAAIAILAFAPRMRKFAVVLLGSVTPLLIGYVLAAGSYVFAPGGPSGRFPFSAIWVMSLASMSTAFRRPFTT